MLRVISLFNRSLFVATCFCALAFARPYDQNVEKARTELSQFMSYYYVEPHPERAPEILKKALSSHAVALDPDNSFLLALFLGRIAQDQPGVLRQYESMLTLAAPEYQPLIVNILSIGGDGQTTKFLRSALNEPLLQSVRSMIEQVLRREIPLSVPDFRQEPVTSPSGADLHWMEFMRTGDARFVIPIIDVLGRDDLLRSKVTAWSASHAADAPALELKLAEIAREQLEGSQETASATAQDLDFALFSSEPPTADRVAALRKVMPVEITESDLRTLVLKAVARWSIGSNLQQHAPIRQLCEEQSRVREPRVKAQLLDLLLKGAEQREDFIGAYKFANVLAELRPHSTSIRTRLSRPDYRLAQLLEISDTSRSPAQSEADAG
ncbi:MAG: hypothetical protein ACREYF_20925, partial [Gammaproteobacteria bacterium]